MSFGRDRKPNGGDGGDGGDVILRGSKNVFDLRKYSHIKRLAAGQGGSGGSERAKGAKGKNLVIDVPLVTIVRDLQKQEVIRIEKEGQEVVLLSGGRGGIGNNAFKGGQFKTLKKTIPAEDGLVFEGYLELNLISDAVFVGFPNAGKSSLLNALTQTKAKTAPYPFTTLRPQLGSLKDLILLDLPGLIEGTAQGKGLGTRFTKHIKLTQVVVYCISIESPNPAVEYNLLKKELKEVDEELLLKPALILLTKSDLATKAEIKAKISSLNAALVLPVSKDNPRQLAEFIKELKKLVTEK